MGVPGQIVLVFQGGWALEAYQAGVYQALHEAGLEPDWIIGTSIGALPGTNAMTGWANSGNSGSGWSVDAPLSSGRPGNDSPKRYPTGPPLLGGIPGNPMPGVLGHSGEFDCSARGNPQRARRASAFEPWFTAHHGRCGKRPQQSDALV